MFHSRLYKNKKFFIFKTKNECIMDEIYQWKEVENMIFNLFQKRENKSKKMLEECAEIIESLHKEGSSITFFEKGIRTYIATITLPMDSKISFNYIITNRKGDLDFKVMLIKKGSLYKKEIALYNDKEDEIIWNETEKLHYRAKNILQNFALYSAISSEKAENKRAN